MVTNANLIAEFLSNPCRTNQQLLAEAMHNWWRDKTVEWPFTGLVLMPCVNECIIITATSSDDKDFNVEIITIRENTTTGKWFNADLTIYVHNVSRNVLKGLVTLVNYHAKRHAYSSV